MRPRSVDHKKIVKYAETHSDQNQVQIGKHFGLSQKQISRVLRDHGVTDRNTNKHGRGSGPNRKPEWSDEQFFWEKLLHKDELGMDRGKRPDKLQYGYDPLLELGKDESATSSDFLAPE
jgi:hypothetical protein